jgi:hypothetical protein
MMSLLKAVVDGSAVAFPARETSSRLDNTQRSGAQSVSVESILRV